MRNSYSEDYEVAIYGDAPVFAHRNLEAEARSDALSDAGDRVEGDWYDGKMDLWLDGAHRVVSLYEAPRVVGIARQLPAAIVESCSWCDERAVKSRPCFCGCNESDWVCEEHDFDV
jgi:hypothetical protein